MKSTMRPEPIFGFECKRTENGKAMMSSVRKQSTGYYTSNASSSSPSLLQSMGDMIYHSFLPVGYPGSVRPEYMTYQIYDSLQALCSYLRGVLCVHAVLIGAGVGQESGDALAAALAWVLKDGVGMLASIVFASSYSTFFTIYIKEWRLFADVINDIGQLLDMASALVPTAWYLPVLSLSAVCKAFCGVAAGATKLCITNHLARSNNAGDLVTKEGTQETAVTLVGLTLGLVCAHSIATSPQQAMALFLFLTAVHVWANYQAAYVLHLESLNPARGQLLVEAILKLMDTHLTSPSEKERGESTAQRHLFFTSLLARSTQLSIAHINASECLANTMRAVYWTQYIHFGCSLSSALTALPTQVDTEKEITEAKLFHKARDRFAASRCSYLLLPRVESDGKGLSVLLRSSAEPVDSFRAFFHCRYLQSQGHTSGSPIRMQNILDSLSVMDEVWEHIVTQIIAEGWCLSSCEFLLFNSDNWLFSDEDDNDGNDGMMATSTTKSKEQ